MSHPSSPAVTTIGAPAGEPVRPGQWRATGGDARTRVWLVQYQGQEERIEADDVEITASGVLAFYRLPSRMDQQRTLLKAISPGLCWRCELEGDR